MLVGRAKRRDSAQLGDIPNCRDGDALGQSRGCPSASAVEESGMRMLSPALCRCSKSVAASGLNVQFLFGELW